VFSMRLLLEKVFPQEEGYHEGTRE
jgi:hypothetical protein